MNDQQLKIRIKLNQTPQSLESTVLNDSEIDQDPNQEKPPLDWYKISAALLLLVMLITIIYWLLAGGKSEFDESKIIPNDNTSKESIERNQNTANLSNSSSAIPVPPPQTMTSFNDVEASQQNEPIQKNVNSELISNKAATSNENHYNPLVVIPSAKPESKEVKQANSQSKVRSFTKSNHVIKAQLTSALRKQEPVDLIDHIELSRNASQPIYFFLHIRNLKGEKISVNWYYQNKQVAKIPFSISNNDWRAHSSKILTKTRSGQWRVTAIDQSGNVLAEQSFSVSSRS